MYRKSLALIFAIMVAVIARLAMLSPVPTADAAPPRPLTIQSNGLPKVTPTLSRITGADLPNSARFGVDGTDLGITCRMPDGGFASLFGDTWDSAQPGTFLSPQSWRSPTMLYSSTVPSPTQPIAFSGAAGLNGEGLAPDLFYNGHNNGEVSVIPTDCISFPETHDVIVSYQSIRLWEPDSDTEEWQTNYAGLAWSHDGGPFVRTDLRWNNDPGNTDPFQVWSMERDGEYVYILSTRAGRQAGPMMLRRVHWDRVLDQGAYECWNGDGWGGECKPLMTGRFGEPSLRKVGNEWAMSYLDIDPTDFHNTAIKTRIGITPAGPWSVPKVQLTWDDLPGLYGGFIHPASTPNQLTLIVSDWLFAPNGSTLRYDVSQFNSSL